MSVPAVPATATATARARPAAPVPGGRLRVVAPPPPTRRRLSFAGACVGLLALGLVGLLQLNIALTRGAYEVDELHRQSILLGEAEQALSERLAAEAAPARLSQRAAELGMVASSSPAFIRLRDGAVLGAPTPAEAAPEPTVVPTPSADPAAAPAATAPAPAAPEPTTD